MWGWMGRGLEIDNDPNPFILFLDKNPAAAVLLPCQPGTCL
jgi:hypothetical protein